MPYVRHMPAERIEWMVANQRPDSMKPLNVNLVLAAVVEDRALHWIGRIEFACEDCVLEQRGLIIGIERLMRDEREPADRKRAGFVETDNRGCAERLDAREAPHQHALARKAVCTHRQEQCENQRKFLRDRRDRHSDGIEDRLDSATGCMK